MTPLTLEVFAQRVLDQTAVETSDIVWTDEDNPRKVRLTPAIRATIVQAARQFVAGSQRIIQRSLVEDGRKLTVCINRYCGTWRDSHLLAWMVYEEPMVVEAISHGTVDTNTIGTEADFVLA